MRKRSNSWPTNVKEYFNLASSFGIEYIEYIDGEEYSSDDGDFLGRADPMWMFSSIIMLSIYEAVEDMGCRAGITSRKGSIKARFPDGITIYVPMEFEDQDNFGYSRVAYAHIGRLKQLADYSIMVDKWNPCSVEHIDTDFTNYIIRDIKKSHERKHRNAIKRQQWK